MPALTREEKETIITFDETPADAVIFTYNKNWQKHLEKRLGLKPISGNGSGGKTYHIPKSRIKPPRAPKRISAATRERLRKQGKTHRQKSPNSSKISTAQPKTQAKTLGEGKTSYGTGTKLKNQEKSPKKLL